MTVICWENSGQLSNWFRMKVKSGGGMKSGVKSEVTAA